MEPALAIELARQTLVTALTVAAPLLGAVLILALCLAILQTIMNLQEQTLTIVPKVITAAAVTFVMAPWVMQSLMDFTIPLLRDVLSRRM